MKIWKDFIIGDWVLSLWFEALVNLSYKLLLWARWFIFIFMYASLGICFDFFDGFWDISSNDKRLVRVVAKTFAQTGTKITIQFYQKDQEGTFKYRQRKSLTTGEFASLADNYTKIKRFTKGKNCDATEKLRKKPNKSKKNYMLGRATINWKQW